MVADACSGMNSMFSLSALGVLFLYLRPQRGRWAGALLLASIVPVSIAANVLRVITLMLVTYHLGDAAGQGFLHEFAGILLFIVALLLLYAIDQLLAWAVARRTR
jgi:exosortase/archaeosortase family protein